MDFPQLRAFAVAARYRSITKAAHELHTSQPALSKQLKKLQEAYDLRLLTRSGLGVDVTDDGLEFLKYVEPILELMDNLERKFLKRRSHDPRYVLKVGGSYGLSASILP